jgi:hypothetical protein
VAIGRCSFVDAKAAFYLKLRAKFATDPTLVTAGGGLRQFRVRKLCHRPHPRQHRAAALPGNTMTTRKNAVAVLIGLAAIAAATPAFAGPTCTSEPRDHWIDEEQMKQKIAEMGYKDIKVFKVTSGNCYEIYGYTSDGKKAEVYFNPVTAAVVKAEIGK